MHLAAQLLQGRYEDVIASEKMEANVLVYCHPARAKLGLECLESTIVVLNTDYSSRPYRPHLRIREIFTTGRSILWCLESRFLQGNLNETEKTSSNTMLFSSWEKVLC